MNIEKKMLPPVPPPCEYVLTLTEEEAELLKNIVGSMNGDLEMPERQLVNKLWNVLNGAGVRYNRPALSVMTLKLKLSK